MSGTDRMLPPFTEPSSVQVEGGVDPLVGLNLSGFVVTRLLAAGGMGLVYLAEHETIGRRAAVKVLKPEVAADAEWTARFLTEARALASMKHRNLIEVLNFGKTPDGRQYLMMEFLEGEPLDAYMHRVGQMSPAAALGLVDQVLNGLAEAHKKGVVHRDLKPSNVFLLREHNGELLVKVIDFGLARQDPVLLSDAALKLPRTGGGASLLAGTPEYIAPEQAQGLKVDGAADLYSLGVMLFEMLAGELPFTAGSVTELMQKHVSERAPALSSRVNGLPEGVEAFVDSLLEKEPAKRPASADLARLTIGRLLKRIASDSTAVRTVLPPPVPTLKIDRAVAPAMTTDQSLQQAFPKKQRALWPLVVAGVVCGGVVAAFALRTEEKPAVVVEAPKVVSGPVVPPPAPVEVAKVAAPEPVKPVVEDDLAPIGTVAPVKKVALRCNPDSKWKKSIANELAEYQKNNLDYRQFEVALSKYRSANTEEECGEVQAALKAARKKLGLPDE